MTLHHLAIASVFGGAAFTAIYAIVTAFAQHCEPAVTVLFPRKGL